MVAEPGLYRDGRTAADHLVTVRSTGDCLEIQDDHGNVLHRWPLALVCRDNDSVGSALRLRCSAFPAARLQVEHGQSLIAVLPPRRNNTLLWAGLAMGVTAVLGLTIWGLPHVAEFAAHQVPIASEREWGQTLATQMRAKGGTCANPAGSAALAALTHRLSAALPESQRPTLVVVMTDSMVNAVALPGGTIILFNGLLKQAENAEQMAGVLAHEMAHVAYRHPLIAAIRGIGLATLATLLTGDLSALAATGAGMVLAGSYSRRDESAADALAVDILQRAEISPQGLADFFRRMKDIAAEMPLWLSTHPELDERRRAVMAIAGTGDAPALPALTAAQWQALRQICD